MRSGTGSSHPAHVCALRGQTPIRHARWHSWGREGRRKGNCVPPFVQSQLNFPPRDFFPFIQLTRHVPAQPLISLSQIFCSHLCSARGLGGVGTPQPSYPPIGLSIPHRAAHMPRVYLAALHIKSRADPEQPTSLQPYCTPFCSLIQLFPRRGWGGKGREDGLPDQNNNQLNEFRSIFPHDCE